MPRLRRLLLLSAIILTLTPTANAELLIVESFDYDVDGLDGLDGGVGFEGAWNVFEPLGTYEVVEPATPMIYTVPGGGTINGGNRAFRFGNDDEFDKIANDTEALSRSFAESFEGDELYFSYLYRYDPDGFIDNNDFVIWWLNDNSGPQLGLKGNGGDGTFDEDLIARVNDQSAAARNAYVPGVNIIEADGETYFIVARFGKDGYSDDPDDYDGVSIWVNPSADEVGSPHAVAQALPTELLHLSLDGIGMRVFDQEPGDAMYWDELRFATTWAEVIAPIGGQAVPGDFDSNGSLTATDIDTLAKAIRDGSTDLRFDLNNDSSVDSTDHSFWIKDPSVANSYVGDANLDGEFSSADFVQAFLAGEYETGNPVGWADGDWNGDGSFKSDDFVAAFLDGGYELGPRPATQAVPEPSTALLAIGAAVLLGCVSRRCSAPAI